MFPPIEGLKEHENYTFQMWYLLRNTGLQPSECERLDTEDRLMLFMSEKALNKITTNDGGIE